MASIPPTPNPTHVLERHQPDRAPIIPRLRLAVRSAAARAPPERLCHAAQRVGAGLQVVGGGAKHRLPALLDRRQVRQRADEAGARLRQVREALVVVWRRGVGDRRTLMDQGCWGAEARHCSGGLVAADADATPTAARRGVALRSAVG
jgi:hypothetical protein